MRRLALVVLALTFVPAANAAELTVWPRDFSPLERRLTVRAELPRAQRVGVQLVTAAGEPLGWLAEPQRRRYLRLRWNGRLHGARVPDGRYRVRLVAGRRELAFSALRIDRTAPTITLIGMPRLAEESNISPLRSALQPSKTQPV